MDREIVRELLARLNHDAERIALRFQLRLKAFYWRVLEWARSEGIYRPGPVAPPVSAPPVSGTGPTQLTLF